VIEQVKPESVGMSEDRLRRVDAWMEQHVERQRLAGVSVLIERRGRVAYFGARGCRSVESGQPIGADTIFRIYSMTKPITSVAAMMLYEEGRFQLDDPIAKFLPEFSEMKVWAGGTLENPQLEPARSLITVRQLLTHTAGFSYDFMSNSPVEALYRREKITFDRGDTSLAEVTQRLATLPLLFHPGTRWNYGFSTDVLGRLVEVVSGQPLDRFFAERIFQPLGMVDTGFHVPEEKVERFAALYTAASGGMPPVLGAEPTQVPPDPPCGLKLVDPAAGRFAKPARILSGGGGLTSTIGDYLRFCRMLRNKGELDGVRLLGRKTVEFMTVNHLNGSLADMGQARFNNAHAGAGLGFGLGFAVVLDPAKTQTIGSVGEYFWTGMANTQFWIDPSEDLIVIQMAQHTPSVLVPLRRELRTLVYQALVD